MGREQGERNKRKRAAMRELKKSYAQERSNTVNEEIDLNSVRDIFLSVFLVDKVIHEIWHIWRNKKRYHCVMRKNLKTIVVSSIISLLMTLFYFHIAHILNCRSRVIDLPEVGDQECCRVYAFRKNVTSPVQVSYAKLQA